MNDTLNAREVTSEGGEDPWVIVLRRPDARYEFGERDGLVVVVFEDEVGEEAFVGSYVCISYAFGTLL
ncbi:MAG: hypothetical protein HRU70_00015 [Phycisphaeraceae bacterium]|nr:MAG: hypothetical protein HRU70_00015 [Phycisphaeraceae bacterium]